MVCQINQNGCLKLCGWVILTKFDYVPHQTELAFPPISVCGGFSMNVPLLSPRPLLLFWNTGTPNILQLPFDQLRSQMLCPTSVPLSMTWSQVVNSGNIGSKGMFLESKVSAVILYLPSSKLLVPSHTCCCSCQSRVAVCSSRGSCC